MRVLIISSAEAALSQFEVAQATILRSRYDVALVSVDVRAAVAESARSLLRGALSASMPADRRSAVRPVRRTAASVAAAALGPRVSHRRLEGVDLYEGVAAPWRQEPGFQAALHSWLSAGRKAVHAYVHDWGEPDLIHAHGRFLNAGPLAMHLKRELGIPYVYTEHSSFYHRGLAPAEARQVLNQVIDEASGFSCVSHALLNDVERFAGRSLAGAVITPNAADDMFESTPSFARPADEPFRFLTVAALEAHKGIDVLLRAFAQSFGGHGGVRLDICGTGSQRGALLQLANELGVGRSVTFRGQVTQREVVERMDAAHALVVPSHVETFCVALIEALLRGRPAIATDCGGPSSIMTPEFGLLVPPGDGRALGKAMRALAARYGEYRSGAIRAEALRRYGREAFARGTAAFYAQALATDPAQADHRRTRAAHR